MIIQKYLHIDIYLSTVVRNLWNGNIFLRPHDLTSHEVIFVDWTHAQVSRRSPSATCYTCYTCVQVAPLTTDVIHVLFTCCDTDIATNMTEALNSYYDYLKVIL